MKKLLSLLLSAALLVSLVSGLGLAAFAAEGTAVEAAVTELTVGENTVYVYAPQNDFIVSPTCTAPAFMFFGEGKLTVDSVKEIAAASGLDKLAAQEGASVVFVSPQGESWTEADAAVYGALIDMYSNSSTTEFVDGIAEEVNFFTQTTATKIMGDTGRVYLYGYKAGADFVAANFMKQVTSSVTYPDGFTMTFDRTPTSITLIDPTTIPTAAEKADIAVAVVNGPADTAANLATLTEKVLVETLDYTAAGVNWVVDSYEEMAGAYRRQVGILLPMHNWADEGIVELFDTYTYADGTSVSYITYYAEDLNVKSASAPVPLVLTFHGGGNTALFQAQASEWPVIGKANGFITVAVDNHTSLDATKTVELIDAIKAEYAIDASRVYASGFSMGSVKSWDLFEQYPTVFAGLAPMSGSFAAPTGEAEYITPVFYVGGEISPLPELGNQGDQITARIGYTLKANKVTDSYTYDADVNLFWGINGDMTYAVTDKVAFTDSTLTVNLFQSEDGRYYTALANSSNMSHEVYARNSWAAWDFLSQFSRNADGTIAIQANTYALTSDDGKIANNSYNTVELPAPADPEPTTYTVVKGDTLWGIAARHLGSGFKWSAIYNANRSIIADPNLIFVGQVLAIPFG